MPDFEYYRVYLQAGLREAERYLLSDQLFWPLNISASLGEPGYPNLTLGSLLFHHASAQASAETVAQKTTLQQIESELDHVRSHWQVAWEAKAVWEFKSRLRQWGNVLKEIRVDPEDNIPYYQYEVRLRVLLDLLQAEIEQVDPTDREHLESLDLLLRAIFVRGDFIWEKALAGRFPADQFWYLWGTLKEP